MMSTRFFVSLQAKLAIGLLWSFAGICAALPFYVHFHPEKFSPPRMEFTGATESEEERLEAARIANAILRPRLEIDQILTGAIEGPLPQKGPRDASMSRQPFPGGESRQESVVQVISITANRALALVDGRMVILKPGDRLGDGRVISGFERSGGMIIPITSETGASTNLAETAER